MSASAPRLLASLLLVAVAGALPGAPRAGAANFGDGFRWSATASDGPNLSQGDPTTLLWSIVPDGLPVDGAASNLVHYLDEVFDVPAAAETAVAERPWFPLLATQLDTLAVKTGLTFQHVADDGAAWGAAGAVGARGDIRLAGYDLPTAGELGRATLPAFGGDVLLDTANTALTNINALATVFQHEVGHALGLGHVAVEGASVLMGTGTLPASGPQFDDLYALTRLYGDRYEPPAASGPLPVSIDWGVLPSQVPVAVGTSAVGMQVSTEAADFVTIDGATDTDLFRFEVAEPSELTVDLEPRGPTYTFTPEGQAPKLMMATHQSDLRLTLLASDGQTPLAHVNHTGLGQGESLAGFDLPSAGVYYLQVEGEQDANQFYRLDVIASDTPFATSPTVFRDQFHGHTADINSQLDAPGRQAAGEVDAPYQLTPVPGTASDSTATIEQHRLTLVATAGEVERTQAAVARNFAPQLAGERWLLSVEVELDAASATDQAAFALVLADQWPPGEPHSEAAALTLQLAADGDYHLTERGGNAQGEANRTGNRPGNRYHLQVLVDETFSIPRVTVAVDGATLLLSEPISFNPAERYVALEALALPGMPTGASIAAHTDQLELILLDEQLPGDFDADGQVTLADFTTWRDQLGRRVLPGTAADATADGQVTLADYHLWRDHFFTPPAAEQLAALPVPEPAASLLLLAGASALGAGLRPRRYATSISS